MPQHFKRQSKRILYTIRKKTNVSSKDVCFGRFNKISSVLRTLSQLKKKGLLFQDNVPLRENNAVSVKAVYWLTPEGIKVADGIVKEIDEYKRW
jgi:DNA-binding PadR family transcriptional regulator